jgi:two-component system nitrogen regulation sensor histidine kinase GlnL
MRSSLFDWFAEAHPLRDTLTAVARNEIATSRFDGVMKRAPVAAHETLPVHVIVNQIDHGSDRVLVEMLEIEQQTKQDREERALGQVQANKELIRNLAHEIKNPLGGIRGAAQLLGMEVTSRELTEYTQVIIHEADRLQALVDRLLAPHRRPHVVGDVNIHEVCERVRSLILAEFPRGLAVLRDYDTSIPDFRGDREQLIQAVLNIAHNAAQALVDRIASGDAQLVLRTRVARQVTIGKQRFRLALELHIEDNGPGVSEDIRDRIFYPLVSGREGGSGLGLTLAQTFVQQHQGMIECDSAPGRTVFSIVIPLP